MTDKSQPTLFGPSPDFSQLRRLIHDQFTGQTVPVEEVERFVIERTPFHAGHYKHGVLGMMEKESPPALQVMAASPKRRRGDFPSGTIVRFL